MRPSRHGTLYIAQFGEGGPVKIGFSFRFGTRLQMLRYCSAVPVTVLRILSGPAWTENEFHLAFRAHRYGGDWFRYDEAMLHYLPQCTSRETLNRFRDSIPGIRRGRRSWLKPKREAA